MSELATDEIRQEAAEIAKNAMGDVFPVHEVLAEFFDCELQLGVAVTMDINGETVRHASRYKTKDAARGNLGDWRDAAEVNGRALLQWAKLKASR